MAKKTRQSLTNRGQIFVIQPEPDFSRTCCFQEVVDNVELITYTKFQKILMSGCRVLGKKPSKIHPKWGFSSICDPQDIFSKIGPCHVCTLMVL